MCVVGTPDDKWGEAVTAVVVLRADAPRDEAAIEAMTAEIQAAVKERKGSVQSPKRVEIVDALPLTGLASRTRRQSGRSSGRCRARRRLGLWRSSVTPAWR